LRNSDGAPSIEKLVVPNGRLAPAYAEASAGRPAYTKALGGQAKLKGCF
jgi:hypothetical protein